MEFISVRMWYNFERKISEKLRNSEKNGRKVEKIFSKFYIKFWEILQKSVKF